MKLKTCVLVLLTLLATTAGAFAQTVGSIEGTITDNTGGALPGAMVEVTNDETGITRSVVTDTEGRYRARDLSLGQYRVHATMPGFQTSIRQGVVLTIGREAVVNFELQIGGVSEELVVTGDAPLIETTNSGMTSLVAREQMEDLPLNARDFSQLISLQGGTTQYRNTGAPGAVISISGARPNSSVFTLDGSDIKTAEGLLPSGVSGAMLGLEAIQEFKILTSTYSAQYGRSAGGTVVAATRSGTNELHGTAYWYVRNDRFDARNFFDVRSEHRCADHQEQDVHLRELRGAPRTAALPAFGKCPDRCGARGDSAHHDGDGSGRHQALSQSVADAKWTRLRRWHRRIHQQRDPGDRPELHQPSPGSSFRFEQLRIRPLHVRSLGSS
jgi:hypothetical protein